MKVKLTESIPGPAPCAIMAAVSWPSRCGQKLLPTCPARHDIGSEQEELYKLGREEHEASLAMHVSQSNTTSWLRCVFQQRASPDCQQGHVSRIKDLSVPEMRNPYGVA